LSIHLLKEGCEDSDFVKKADNLVRKHLSVIICMIR
jgi:hypothetical protein